MRKSNPKLSSWPGMILGVFVACGAAFGQTNALTNGGELKSNDVDVVVASVVLPDVAHGVTSLINESGATPQSPSNVVEESKPSANESITRSTRRSGREENSSGGTNLTSKAVKSSEGAVTGQTFESFRIIGERNIFNPSRSPRSSRSGSTAVKRQPKVESFALVGTMSYSKGDLAFFESSVSQYRKSVKKGDTIGAYKVQEVTASSVKLGNDKQEIELKVGQQMRREDEEDWKLSGDVFTTSPGGGSKGQDSSGSPESPGSSGGGGEDEVLKRMMEKRAKELN